MKEQQEKYNLPEGWSWATIDELIDSRTGLFKDGDWIETKDQNPEGEIRLIQLADIGDGFFRNRSDRFMSRETAIDLNCTFLKQGDILVARMPDPIGRACLFPFEEDGKFVTVVDVAVIRVGDNSINNKLLLYFINSPIIRKQIEELQTGTTRKRISRGNLATIKFPIPPLNEQNKIVSTMEELFHELDRCVNILKNTQDKLKIYKQALTRFAFEGKLTEKWRLKNHPKSSDILLEKIKQDRRKLYNQELEDWKALMKTWIGNGKKGKRPKKPIPIKKLEPLVDSLTNSQVPSLWKWIKIGDFEKLVSSGATPKGGQSTYLTEGIPFIRSMNVHNNKLDLNGLVYIDELTHERMDRSQINENDVLLNITGASIGRSAYIPSEFGKANVNQHVCIIRTCTKDINYKYLSKFLNSPVAQGIIQNINSGATREALTFEQIRNFPFPLCSVDEQDYIVSILESQYSFLDKLELIILESLRKSEILRQAILKKAFEGKLVFQDTNNAPISNILEQIKVEKEKHLADLKEQKKGTPKKIKKMSKNLTIEDVLKTSDKPMNAKEVWQLSKHKSNIEDFYKELKDIQEKVKVVTKGTESILTLVK